MSIFPPAADPAVHLNRYHHFTRLMRDQAIEGELRRFRSAYDGALQTTLTLRPAGERAEKTFFFFHGMDGDSGDAVIVGDLVKHLRATVVALGGRGAAWVSREFVADAEQVIRAQPVDHGGFYLMGVSMGGTQALALAGLLPEDLRRLVRGVCAFIPGVNLSAVAERSSNIRVRQTVLGSVRGDFAALDACSPVGQVARYTPGLPFLLVYNLEDGILLTDELERFISIVRRAGHPVAAFAAPGDHDFTYTNFDYREAFSHLGCDLPTPEAPPLVTEG